MIESGYSSGGDGDGGGDEVGDMGPELVPSAFSRIRVDSMSQGRTLLGPHGESKVRSNADDHGVLQQVRLSQEDQMPPPEELL